MGKLGRFYALLGGVCQNGENGPRGHPKAAPGISILAVIDNEGQGTANFWPP